MLRFADLLTSYLCMKKYGGWEEIEVNPFSSWLIHSLGFTGFMAVNLFFSLLVFYLIIKKRYMYYFMVLIMVFVVLVNSFVFFMI